MTCSAYDLVLIPFPYADLSSSKKRPVLVLTAPDHHGDFIALAVTTVPQSKPAIPLTPMDIIEGTLPKPSLIRVNKVFTLSDQNIVKHIGKIKTACMEKVLKNLCSIVGYAKWPPTCTRLLTPSFALSLLSFYANPPFLFNQRRPAPRRDALLS